MISMFAMAALAIVFAVPMESGPTREGIVVRGSWTIDVRDPNGQLVMHRQFENGLTTSGRRILATLLTQQLNSTPTWAVELASPFSTMSPCGSAPCGTLQTSVPTGVFPSTPRNLALNVVDDAIVLSGSITATTDGQITSVATHLMGCSGTGCSAMESFSGKTLAPISIAAGQIVQVKVVISFTSATSTSTPQ
jgi:hypothetical protein